MLVAYQVQVADEVKTAKLRRRRRRVVVKHFTEPTHFVIPEGAISDNPPNGNVTLRLLLEYLPLQGDFHLRVKIPDVTSGDHDSGSGDDDGAFLWKDLNGDLDAALPPFGDVISVRCVPRAVLARNDEADNQRLSAACNAADSELLAPASKTSEISEKVEVALEQMKKEGKETLKKMANGLKAFGALFKKKPSGFSVE